MAKKNTTITIALIIALALIVSYAIFFAFTEGTREFMWEGQEAKATSNTDFETNFGGCESHGSKLEVDNLTGELKSTTLSSGSSCAALEAKLSLTIDLLDLTRVKTLTVTQEGQARGTGGAAMSYDAVLQTSNGSVSLISVSKGVNNPDAVVTEQLSDIVLSVDTNGFINSPSLESLVDSSTLDLSDASMVISTRTITPNPGHNARVEFILSDLQITYYPPPENETQDNDTMQDDSSDDDNEGSSDEESGGGDQGTQGDDSDQPPSEPSPVNRAIAVLGLGAIALATVFRKKILGFF